MEQEIWKDIPGYKGLYQVSNLGNVKSLNYRNKYITINKEKILKKHINGSGYYSISLCKDGKSKTTRIHKLVGLLFLYKVESKNNINHIDGNKLNNNVSNLEWCTSSENNFHAYDTGLKKVTDKNLFKSNHPYKGKFGKYNHSSKKVNQYDLEGNFIKTWDSTMDIKRILGINNNSVSLCCRGVRKIAGGFKWGYII